MTQKSLKAFSISAAEVVAMGTTMWKVVPKSTIDKKVCLLSLMSWAYSTSMPVVSPNSCILGSADGLGACGWLVDWQVSQTIPRTAFKMLLSQPASLKCLIRSSLRGCPRFWWSRRKEAWTWGATEGSNFIPRPSSRRGFSSRTQRRRPDGE